MNWNTIEQQWQEQLRKAVAPPAWDATTFEKQRAKIARTLARRDWLEAGVSFTVAAFFAAILSLLDRVLWSGWAAVGILVVMGGFFLRERWRARRLTPPREAALRDRVEGELAELRHQRRLLRSVLWWYVLPFLLVVTLLVWGVLGATPEPMTAETGKRLALFSLACLGMSGVVVWLNRRAVRDWIDPQIANLERVRSELVDPQIG
jgi:hypothetical protein